MEEIRIRDPGWVKSRIQDKHPGSETLVVHGLPAIFFIFCSVFLFTLCKDQKYKVLTDSLLSNVYPVLC
jgi:hypothetical protein